MKKALIPLALAATLAAAAYADARSGGRMEAPQASERGEATATLTLRSSRFGKILFDARGRVLYTYSTDRRTKPSRCYGICAREWPVYFAKGRLRAGKGVRQSLIGTTRRRDGRRQVTYNGWPLYYYAHEGPGEVKCQKVTIHGGTWLVIRANGARVR
jgi:predicted lipoprotein with Yx(FWY)xxD motif